MTRIRKKVSKSGLESGQVSLSPDELRTAGIKVGDTVEVDAERDWIVIRRISQESEGEKGEI